MENSRNFSENTVGNNAIVNQGNGNHITVNADTSNADTSFLREISRTDPVYDKKRILMLKGPLLWESFSWILKHQQFNEWRYTKRDSVLWIKGDPGKGKTMLLCGIIEDLEQNSSGENLSYFFCQATDYRINTAAAVMGGLIQSLLKQHPALLSRIRESHGNGPKGQLDGPNALVVLSDIFGTITNDTGLTNVICVVDALDECITDCRHLLNLIRRTSGRVKWLFSSRNEKDIEKGLNYVRQEFVLELGRNAERISTSIDAYIRHHIHEIEALKDDEQLQTKTLHTLKSKAQGTFLWVALVVEQLHNTDHWKVEDVLEEVPKDLENLYGLILDRTEKLGQKGREACQVLLSIVTTAKRPLHLRELLVFINSHWKDSKHFKATYKLRDILDMAKDCGSVLSIREDTVYFIHQSAKDYIIENAAQRIFPMLHQHYKMFETSLEAMSDVLDYDIYCLKDPGIHIDKVPPRDGSSDPLASIRYCCVFWVEHLVSGYRYEGFEHDKYLKDYGRLHFFLKEKFLCWIESLSLMRNFYPHARIVLKKLWDLIKSYCSGGGIESEASQNTQFRRESETHGLRRFIDDAYRFVEGSKASVAYWPLQLYFSSMNFGQDDSTIWETFERTIREKFGPSPILASARHGPSSAKLQSTVFIPDESFAYANTNYFSNSLVFSPDSSLIGGITVNGSFPVFQFWRADSGTLECTFHISPSCQNAFFSDSNELISVSRSGVMKRWNIAQKSCVGEQFLIPEYADPGSNDQLQWDKMEDAKERLIAWSPNGDFVASWHRGLSHGKGLVRIWDTMIARRGSSFETGKERYNHAVFSPNSQLLAIPSSGGIMVYSTNTGAEVKFLASYTGMDFSRNSWIGNSLGDGKLEYVWFSPNSEFLINMRSDQELGLHDTHIWQQQHIFETYSRQPQRLVCVAISPDSMILAAGLSNETKLWSIGNRNCIAIIPTNSLSIAFAPDWTQSSLIALQQHSSVIQTWSINVSQTLSELRQAQNSFDIVAISPDSRFVASRHKSNGDIYIRSGDDHRLVHTLKGEAPERDSPYYPLIFSPDSQVLAYAVSSGVQIWRVVTGEAICLLRGQDDRRFSSIAISSDPKHLVAGDFFGGIYIWHIDSGQLIHKYELGNEFEEPMGILTTSISPESAYVAVFWSIEKVQGRIWHLHTGETVVAGADKDHPGKNLHINLVGKAQIFFSSDSTILACITESKAQIFDVTTGAGLQSFDLDGNEHPRLISFDPINGRIFNTKSIFYKTSSWKHWQKSSRLGYSYDYHLSDPLSKRGIWILLDGKKHCYVPNKFRPGLLEWPRDTGNVAMTDSLLAILNGLGEVVIIKLPSRPESTTTSIGFTDVGLTLQDIPDSVGNSYLVANALATSNSGLRPPKRKRRISSDSNTGGEVIVRLNAEGEQESKILEKR